MGALRRVWALVKESFTPHWEETSPTKLSLTSSVLQAPKMAAVLEAAATTLSECDHQKLGPYEPGVGAPCLGCGIYVG